MNERIGNTAQPLRYFWEVRVAAIILGLIVGGFAAEIGVRAYLLLQRTAGPDGREDSRLGTYWPTVYSERSYGFDYGNETGSSLELVTNFAGTEAATCRRQDYLPFGAPHHPAFSWFRAGDRGIGEPYRSIPWSEAELKIAVFGGSFAGAWPDIVEYLLRMKTGVKVSIANLARDGTGMLSMLDTAATLLPEMKPDITIFGFTVSNLRTGRVWRGVKKFGDLDRVIAASVPLAEVDPSESDTYADIAILSPDVPEICKVIAERNARGEPPLRADESPLLRKIAMVRRELRRESNAAFRWKFLQLRHSYLFDLLVYRNPYRSVAREDLKFQGYTLHELFDFEEDERARHDIEVIKAVPSKVVLYHLPMLDRESHDNPIKFGADGANKDQEQALFKSVERVLQTKTTYLAECLPASIKNPLNLMKSPLDSHPNEIGTLLYADCISDWIISNFGLHRLPEGPELLKVKARLTEALHVASRTITADQRESEIDGLLKESDRQGNWGDTKTAFHLIESAYLLSLQYEKEGSAHQRLRESRLRALAKGIALLETANQDDVATTWKGTLVTAVADFRAVFGAQALAALRDRRTFMDVLPITVEQQQVHIEKLLASSDRIAKSGDTVRAFRLIETAQLFVFRYEEESPDSQALRETRLKTLATGIALLRATDAADMAAAWQGTLLTAVAEFRERFGAQALAALRDRGTFMDILPITVEQQQAEIEKLLASSDRIAKSGDPVRAFRLIESAQLFALRYEKESPDNQVLREVRLKALARAIALLKANNEAETAAGWQGTLITALADFRERFGAQALAALRDRDKFPDLLPITVETQQADIENWLADSDRLAKSGDPARAFRVLESAQLFASEYEKESPDSQALRETRLKALARAIALLKANNEAETAAGWQGTLITALADFRERFDAQAFAALRDRGKFPDPLPITVETQQADIENWLADSDRLAKSGDPARAFRVLESAQLFASEYEKESPDSQALRETRLKALARAIALLKANNEAETAAGWQGTLITALADFRERFGAQALASLRDRGKFPDLLPITVETQQADIENWLADSDRLAKSGDPARAFRVLESAQLFASEYEKESPDSQALREVRLKALARAIALLKANNEAETAAGWQGTLITALADFRERFGAQALAALRDRGKFPDPLPITVETQQADIENWLADSDRLAKSGDPARAFRVLESAQLFASEYEKESPDSQALREVRLKVLARAIALLKANNEAETAAGWQGTLLTAVADFRKRFGAQAFAALRDRSKFPDALLITAEQQQADIENWLADSDRLAKSGDLARAFRVLESAQLFASEYERESPDNQALRRARLKTLTRGIVLLKMMDQEAEAASTWQASLVAAVADFQQQFSQGGLITLQDREAFLQALQAEIEKLLAGTDRLAKSGDAVRSFHMIGSAQLLAARHEKDFVDNQALRGVRLRALASGIVLLKANDKDDMAAAWLGTLISAMADFGKQFGVEGFAVLPGRETILHLLQFEIEKLLADGDQLAKAGDAERAFHSIETAQLLTFQYERNFPEDEGIAAARLVSIAKGVVLLKAAGNDDVAAQWHASLVSSLSQFRVKFGESALIVLHTRGVSLSE